MLVIVWALLAFVTMAEKRISSHRECWKNLSPSPIAGVKGPSSMQDVRVNKGSFWLCLPTEEVRSRRKTKMNLIGLCVCLSALREEEGKPCRKAGER